MSFKVASLLAAYASVGPTIVPPASTPGMLIPLAQVASGVFGSPGSNFPPALVAIPTVAPVDVVGIVPQEFAFRTQLGQGGELGGYRFRASATWAVTVAAATPGTTGRLICHIRVLDAAGVVVATLSPVGGLLGATQPLDAGAPGLREWYDAIATTAATFSPAQGEQLEMAFQLEIVVAGAAADTVTWALANGTAAAGPTLLEIDGGGVG